jgi:hypothetical protein
MFVSIKGSSYARFRRALRTGNLNVIRGAAAELPRIPLEDALTITALLREDPAQFEKAALRWLGRFCLEARDIAFEDAAMALAALRLIPIEPEQGWLTLDDLRRRLGLPEPVRPRLGRSSRE